jgi:hypothetical protein
MKNQEKGLGAWALTMMALDNRFEAPFFWAPRLPFTPRGLPFYSPSSSGESSSILSFSPCPK